MIVRRLAAGDPLEGAAALLRRFFQEHGFETSDAVIAANLRTMAAMPMSAVFVVEADGAAVGVATVSMTFGIEFGWSGEAGDLYVQPAWRGKGLSRLLMSAVEDFLRQRNATCLLVTVTGEAERVRDLRRFYASLGFADERRAILSRRL